MRTILVATNFSKTADNAVRYSASLAQLFNTKLILFNAFKLPVHASNTYLSAATIENLIKINKDRLKETALGLTKEFGIEVEHKCSYVDLEREIDSLMETHNVRFLVMGMSPKSIEQNLLGNPTTTLISMKKFPVLAIPVNAQFTGIQNTLFACDLMQGIPLKTLARLRQIALKLKTEVTVFYVEKKIGELALKNNALDKIDKELEGVTYLYKNVKSDTVIEEIEKEIKKSNANLLVMVPKKYGFWGSIVHKSKTRVMASGLNIPLLSIPVE
ncbi:universal stress protein [Flavivirga sp. 57AJ16]|uniref:universal stress protein n=1 Tax=Flavivirga sp. 57AJ16 TaxID=3025307 RepID=UPI002365BC05|nr:universal stress protein [Flavivirga sp. 57AJ16]MDD7888144.1 universal stress protein [Flavivirga sp. 57AJ16]